MDLEMPYKEFSAAFFAPVVGGFIGYEIGGRKQTGAWTGIVIGTLVANLLDTLSEKESIGHSLHGLGYDPNSFTPADFKNMNQYRAAVQKAIMKARQDNRNATYAASVARHGVHGL